MSQSRKRKIDDGNNTQRSRSQSRPNNKNKNDETKQSASTFSSSSSPHANKKRKQPTSAAAKPANHIKSNNFKQQPQPPNKKPKTFDSSSTNSTKKPFQKKPFNPKFSKNNNNNNSSGGSSNFKKFGKNNKFDKNSKSKPKILSRQDRKTMRQARKALKPNADVALPLNHKVWSASLATLSKTQQAEKVEEFMTALKGKMAEVAVRHDTSRALQTMVKHGNAQQRQAIAQELKGHYIELSNNHYAHFLVLKLLQFGSLETKKLIQSEFVHHVRRLCLHADASKVLDYLYAASNKIMQFELRQELYGAEFSMFGTDTNATETKTGANGATSNNNEERGMTYLLQKYPSKKELILSNVREFLDRMAEKSMLMFRIVHTLVLEYLQHAPHRDAASLIESLDSATLALYHSRDGALALVRCFGYGTIRDRKALLKSLKGSVAAIAQHEHGHMVLMSALDVVDDTVLLSKSILSELKDLDKLLEHKYANRVILHLLAPHNPQYFTQFDQEVLKRPTVPRYIMNQGKTDNEQAAQQLVNPDAAPLDDNDMVPTSKKNPAIRRQELLRSLLVPVLNVCLDQLGVIIRSASMSRILYEAVVEAHQLMHQEKLDSAYGDLKSLVESILDAIGALVSNPDHEQVKPQATKKRFVAFSENIGQQPSSKDDDDDDKEEQDGDNDEAEELPNSSSTPAETKSSQPNNNQESVLGHALAHLVYKRLITNLKPNAHLFIDKLWHHISTLGLQPEKLTQLLETNRAGFVIDAMLKHGSDETKSQITKALAPHLKLLQDQTDKAGCQALCKALQS